MLANQVKVGRLSGEVLFNGKPANEKTHHREVAFVAQEDVHFRMFNSSHIYACNSLSFSNAYYSRDF